MSYLDRIGYANRRDLTHARVFLIGGRALGWIAPWFAEALSHWPAVFELDEQRVQLRASIDNAGPEKRTAEVANVVATLRAEGVVTGWRDEDYPVIGQWGEAPVMLMERAAVPLFGLCGFGVHMNGYCRTSEGLSLWVAKRSATKPTYPGELDQLVAGGQPVGLGLKANLVKECAEEAGIPRALAEQAQATGTVTYAVSTERGFQPDVLFTFDLELPADFRPVNQDGEVDEFFLWPVAKVAETVRTTDAFKFNCALVAIDFLVRHGIISPEEPDYAEIVAGLRGRERFLAGL